MDRPHARELTPAQERFALYLEAAADDPALDLERFARETPELAHELRRLHAAWSRGRAGLADLRATSEAAAVRPPGLAPLDFGLEVLEELGRGGFGRVLRARDRALGREVAVKVIDREAVAASDLGRRFVDEARALARVRHENVVQVHAVEPTDDGGVRIVQELVRGSTLATLVERGGPLSCEEAAAVGAALCRGLAAVHAAGLLHLDVKPGNAMRDTSGRIVLLDFGLARERARGAGPVGGTPPYMAPEHLRGVPDLDARADVYAVGVTLYWLVAGRLPFDAADRDGLLQQVLDGRHVPLTDARPDAPPAFVELLERAMAPERERRFTSPGELEAALRRFLAGESAPAPARRPSSPAPSRRRLLLVGSAALAAALAALLVPFGSSSTAPLAGRVRFLRESPSGAVDELREGARVRVGDRLHLEVSAAEPFHLYVYTEDAQGYAARLWPERGGASVPLPADTVHHVPSEAGLPLAWPVETAGGEEHLFVVQSVEPLPWLTALDRAIVGADGAARRVTRDDARALDLSMRGISASAVPSDAPRAEGGASAAFSAGAPDAPVRPRELFERFDELAGRDGRHRVVALRLVNPD